MIIDATQLHIGRRSLNLSLRDLGQLSGLTASGISQIERTGQFQAYSMKALQAALIKEGVIFGLNGSVAVKMKWEQGRPSDAKIRTGVLQILNAARQSHGQAPFIDIED